MTRVQPAFWVPEVLQGSMMDCGPAALQSVLRGFGLSIDYDELRNRCATDVDGTSLDALAAIALKLGLTSQAMPISRDDLLLPEARCLPAIALTRSAGSLLHFVVVWNQLGPFVQIMDPGSGRHWRLRRSLLADLPDHVTRLSRRRFERWQCSRNALEPLRVKLRALGLCAARIEHWIAQLCREPTAESYACFDAALRMVGDLVARRAIGKGARAERVLASAFAAGPAAIPQPYFWLRSSAPGSEHVELHGPVIVHVASSRAQAAHRARAHTPAVLTRPPMAVLWQRVREDSGATWLGVALATLASAGLTLAEILLAPGLLFASAALALPYQRAGALLLVAGLIGIQAWLELWTFSQVRRAGHRLESKLRLALHRKLPRLEDSYLRTRPVSDLANRAQSAHALREVPVLWLRSLRSSVALLSSTLGLIWLFPEGTTLLLLLIVIVIGGAWFGTRSLSELTLRLRAQGSALQQLALDALTAAVPVRVHGSQRALRIEHEHRLGEWSSSFRGSLQRSLVVHGLQLFVSNACVCAFIAAYAWLSKSTSPGLLVALWALRLPAAAVELAGSQVQLRNLRSIVVRLLAALAAPEIRLPAPAAASGAAVAIEFRQVQVRAGTSAILDTVELDVPAGAHIGIVGVSGAGKSALLGTLLGTVECSTGKIAIDGEELTASNLAALRAVTAWVDPSVRLWDESLFDNLVYASRDDPRCLAAALPAADLHPVLECLPEGFQSRLGEAGGQLSGGQGQRVRIGRGWLQQDARLVLLDEPFRGLDRAQRRALLERMRGHFAHATLLCVSHDVSDTLDFERVLVLHAGRIAEDGAPRALAAEPDSHYARLLAAERTLESELWSAAQFSRAQIAGGSLRTMEGA
jgi:ABC-type bacteriocin/lantibiotic exporter with double-glycine peptidase domain